MAILTGFVLAAFLVPLPPYFRIVAVILVAYSLFLRFVIGREASR